METEMEKDVENGKGRQSGSIFNATKESMTEWMLVARLRELLYQQSAQSHNSTADHE